MAATSPLLSLNVATGGFGSGGVSGNQTRDEENKSMRSKEKLISNSNEDLEDVTEMNRAQQPFLTNVDSGYDREANNSSKISNPITKLLIAG